MLLAGCLALSAFTALTLTYPRFGPEPDPSHYLAQIFPLFVGYVLTPGLVQPLAAATAVLVVTAGSQGGGMCARVAHLLSQPAFLRLADLSYNFFLLHPMVSLVHTYYNCMVHATLTAMHAQLTIPGRHLSLCVVQQP